MHVLSSGTENCCAVVDQFLGIKPPCQHTHCKKVYLTMIIC
jgi:hypothetical protein